MVSCIYPKGVGRVRTYIQEGTNRGGTISRLTYCKRPSASSLHRGVRKSAQNELCPRRFLTYHEQAQVFCYEDGCVQVDLGPIGRAILAPVQLQQLPHDGWVYRHLRLTEQSEAKRRRRRDENNGHRDRKRTIFVRCHQLLEQNPNPKPRLLRGYIAAVVCTQTPVSTGCAVSPSFFS